MSNYGTKWWGKLWGKIVCKIKKQSIVAIIFLTVGVTDHWERMANVTAILKECISLW